MRPRPLAVIEDSDEDFAALQRAFSDSPVDIIRYRDGAEALAGLRQAVQDVEMWPEVLLVDLNLPGHSGIDVLTVLRSEPALRLLPIIVLSGSSRREDIHGAYEQGANAYVVKPLDYQELRSALSAMWDFWDRVSVPSPPNQGMLDPGYGLL